MSTEATPLAALAALDPLATLAPIPSSPAQVVLGRLHARRLREIYRSAGWPCQDLIEIDLLAAGMLIRVTAASGHETLRVTDAGIALLAETLQRNRSSLSAHEALVEQVAREMVRNGRIAWRNLSLRAKLPETAGGETGVEPGLQQTRWCMARPDVFSIRNTSVPTYVDPVVHEIKVRRSDLQSDLRNPDKRAAYLDMGGECWYVLGNDAKGRPVATVQEVPAECGVMLLDGSRLVVARPAPLKPRRELPFHVWMALAKTTPLYGLDEDTQQSLSPVPANDSAPEYC